MLPSLAEPRHCECLCMQKWFWCHVVQYGSLLTVNSYLHEQNVKLGHVSLHGFFVNPDASYNYALWPDMGICLGHELLCFTRLAPQCCEVL